MEQTLTALQILQNARTEILQAPKYNRTAYWVLCNAINHLIGCRPQSTVNIFQYEISQ